MGPALVSLTEYLDTSYEPDMDYVDGVLISRNPGTQLHGLLHTILGTFFGQRRKSCRIETFAGARLLVDEATARYRIPDVMVVNMPYRKGKVVTDVPAVIVEIKSADDMFDDILDRCFDYERLGSRNVPIMDPEKKRAWSFEQGGLRLLTESSFRLNLNDQVTIEFPWADLFPEFDGE